MSPQVLWRRDDVGPALAALAAAAQLQFTPQARPAAAAGGAGDDSVAIDLAAAGLGLDVRAAAQAWDQPARMLAAAAPALVPVGEDVLAVVSAGRQRMRLAVPGGGVLTVPTRDVAAAVAGAAGDDPTAPVPVWWLVRSSPGTSFWRQCRSTGLPLRVAALVAAHAAEYCLFLGSWAVLGRAAFAGDVDGGALLAWALLLAATVPARAAATRLQADVAIGAGWLLRRRLLHGTLRLRPDETRREGAGQFLGRALEAEAIEDLAIGGGLLGALATVEVTLAVAVLAAGPGPLLPALLGAWVAMTVAAAHRYLRRRRRWATARLANAHDLIEKMVGHRTRLVQQAAEQWHQGEVERLAAYDALGRAMDRRLLGLLTVATRGWMVVAAAGLGVEVAWGSSPAEVAVGAGGILLALVALTKLVNGLAQLADAAVAWSHVAPLFDAATRTYEGTAPPSGPAGTPSSEPPLLVAEDLGYHYDGRDEPALAGCSFRIDVADRLLLEGPSGSGKSTVAALLAGLRLPTEGQLMLRGADRASVGAPAWRRRVVSAPQFHENHVVLGPLAFNLLVGRGWPAQPEDLKDAFDVCMALGLGPLLDRMPAGLAQMVGDTGWQLSHGERSLVFLARALLQGADIVLLDETFGSLDPATMRRALAVALARAETIVVIRQ